MSDDQELIAAKTCAMHNVSMVAKRMYAVWPAERLASISGFGVRVLQLIAAAKTVQVVSNLYINSTYVMKLGISMCNISGTDEEVVANRAFDVFANKMADVCASSLDNELADNIARIRLD